MFFLEDDTSLNDENLYTTFDDYFKSVKEYSNSEEENIVNNIINNYMSQNNLNEEEDMEDDLNKELKNNRSFAKRSKDKAKAIAVAQGKTITKYIHKTLHFKSEELATETFPRKLVRAAISVVLICGSWVMPVGLVTKLIATVAGAYIANAVSIRQKKNLIDLYNTKLDQVEKKIDECDDDKELYELKKIKNSLENEMVKVKKSLDAGKVAYDRENNIR